MNSFALPSTVCSTTRVTVFYVPDCPFCAIAKDVLEWLKIRLTHNFSYEFRQASELPLRYEVGTLPALKEDGRDKFATDLIHTFQDATPITAIGYTGEDYSVIRGCDRFLSAFKGELRIPNHPEIQWAEIIKAALTKEELERLGKNISVGGLNGIWYAIEIYKYYNEISNIRNHELEAYLGNMAAHKERINRKIRDAHINIYKEAKNVSKV
jgi:glutaredoxin